MQDRRWFSTSSSGGSVSVIPEHHSEITATLRSPVIDCEPDTDREEDTPTLLWRCNKLEQHPSQLLFAPCLKLDFLLALHIAPLYKIQELLWQTLIVLCNALRAYNAPRQASTKLHVNVREIMFQIEEQFSQSIDAKIEDL